MAQKHQDSEGELQPSPVPEDIARESEAPSDGDSEHGQSDGGSDAPGSQTVPAAGWLLLEDGVVHRRILTWPGRARHDALSPRLERQAGSGLARARPPAFTLATYVHLLPDDLPDSEFLDALLEAPSCPCENQSMRPYVGSSSLGIGFTSAGGR
jgi:hypothetical protein